MDNLDNLIIDRLGEHQRKMNMIATRFREERKPRLFTKHFGVILTFAAACVVLLTLVFPTLLNSSSYSDMQLTTPSFAEYRGGGYETIEQLISNKEYEEALKLLEKEIEEMEMEKSLVETDSMSIAEKDYIMALHQDAMEELLWARIYLQAKLDKEKDLMTSCEKYLTVSSYTRHRAEVETILREK